MRSMVGGAISESWWRVFGALGLSRARWEALPKIARRTVKASIWTAIVVKTRIVTAERTDGNE